MTYYVMCWTTSNNRRVINQIYTAEHIANKLAQLEQEGSHHIRIDSARETLELKGIESRNYMEMHRA